MKRLVISATVIILLAFVVVSCSKSARGSGSSIITTINNCEADTIGNAIVLWGMVGAGANSFGQIFSIRGDGTDFQTQYVLTANSGDLPTGSLCKAHNGILYGMTVDGGVYNQGTVFSFNPTGKVFTKLYDFSNLIHIGESSALGGGNASFLLANDGKLYAAVAGDSAGVIVLDPSSGSINLYSFYNQDYNYAFRVDTIAGPPPVGKLMQGNDGKLYGTTTTDAINSYPTIWSFDPNTFQYNLVHQFTDGNVAPTGTLCLAADGNIYGSGISVSGQDQTYFLFKISTTGNYSVLKMTQPFTGLAAFGNDNNLVSATSDLLYGIVSNESGNMFGGLFSYKVSTGDFTNLFSFSKASGNTDYGAITLASNGLIYGITGAGGEDCNGNQYYGTIFRFDPSLNKLKIIYGYSLNETLSGAAITSVYGSLIEY